MGAVADIAQLVEHLIRNEGVLGSNPSIGTILKLLETIHMSHAAVLNSKWSQKRPYFFSSRGPAGLR